MKKMIIALLVVVMLVPSLHSPVMAQSPDNVRLAALEIAIWPEYDQSGVLVIYRAQVAPAVPLPANVLLRIPATAMGGKPHAVAGNDPLQGLLNIPNTVTPQEDWLLVSFTTAYSAFQLEFYDALDTAKAERSYTLKWPGDMSVDNVILQVQEPFGASQFLVTPAVDAGQREASGLVYHQANLGSWPAGQASSIVLAYSKTDARTSVEALRLGAPTSTPQIAAAPAANPTWPPWMIGGIVLGIGLIIAGMIWYVLSQRGDDQGGYVPTAAQRNKRGWSRKGQHAIQRSRPRLPLGEAEQEPAAGFCAQCGRTLQAGDTFCPQCGTRRRKA